MFYILSKDGTPLMPTTRYRHIKNLAKAGKAVKVRSKPYTVQLLYDTPGVTQDIILGIDPGRTNIGLCAVREDGTPVFKAEVQTRNKEIPNLMRSRKQHRQMHRSKRRRAKRVRRAVAANTVTSKPCKQYKQINTSKSVGIIERTLPGYEEPVCCIGIKNKEARFNNRRRPSNWLTPTANQLRETHINVVRKIQKILPITRIVLEVNRFAFMAMDNPNVQKWQYSKGPLYGKGSVRDAVYEMQDGQCLLCGGNIDHYHHVAPRSKGGSDTLPNIVGLCAHCHDQVHKDEAVRRKLEHLKSGQNKKYGALSVLNQIIPSLVDAYANMLPASVTDGRSTKQFRCDHALDKTHYMDAYCIACSVLGQPTVCKGETEVYHIRQFRRHDRQACNQERLIRKYILDGKVVAENRHKAEAQFKDSLEEYVAHGGRTDNLTVKPHPAVYKNMTRLLPGALMLADEKPKVMTAQTGRQPNGLPGYYYFADGSRATPKHCVLLCHNAGMACI